MKGNEGQYRIRIMDDTKGGDCTYPGVELPKMHVNHGATNAFSGAS